MTVRLKEKERERDSRIYDLDRGGLLTRGQRRPGVKLPIKGAALQALQTPLSLHYFVFFSLPLSGRIVNFFFFFFVFFSCLESMRLASRLVGWLVGWCV